MNKDAEESLDQLAKISIGYLDPVRWRIVGLALLIALDAHTEVAAIAHKALFPRDTGPRDFSTRDVLVELIVRLWGLS